MDGVQYLYVGVTIIWFGIFAYIVYLHKMQIKLLDKIKSIEMRVKTDEKKD